MDRINKFLQRLSSKELLVAEGVITQILEGNIRGLDIKKLKGQEFFFRARKGDLRVIFWRKGSNVRIVSVERRNEQTYRSL
jgi:mRNA-degrading endonuclease RelE of RelBE toxin-antitoxin system